jgi:phosphonoacetaldehyde hydrolase
MYQPFRHLRAAVFDWAGTMVDHGSLAPMGVFVEAFARFGIDISIDEARGPMGMAKRPHVAALMSLPRVAGAWREKHGRSPTEADIDAVYEVFVPMNVEVEASLPT